MINYEKGAFKLGKGDIYVLYTAFVFGTGTTNDRYILSIIDPYPYMVLGFILPGIVNILIFRKSVKGIGHILNVKFLGSFLVYVFIYILGSITFYLAMGTTDNSSQLSSLSLLQGILTVILSIIIFKEKDRILVKILAGVISLVGLLMLV
jgi:drug/metabolite transporter (DMT)-like permease